MATYGCQAAPLTWKLFSLESQGPIWAGWVGLNWIESQLGLNLKYDDINLQLNPTINPVQSNPTFNLVRSGELVRVDYSSYYSVEIIFTF